MVRHILVTGAGSGIGAAIARRFAEAGDNVALCARSAEGIERVASALYGASGRLLTLTGDVSARTDAERIVRSAEESLGPVDVLVNNAGIYPAGSIADFRESDLDDILDTNVKGVVWMTRCVLHGMAERRRGRIVNVSSVDGQTPGRCNSIYSASKAAVNSFTRSAALESAPYGVLVNAVAPGWVATEKVKAGVRWRDALSEIPLGRLAEPEEIAGAVFFLCSADASYITGEILSVNGGIYMG